MQVLHRSAARHVPVQQPATLARCNTPLLHCQSRNHAAAQPLQTAELRCPEQTGGGSVTRGRNTRTRRQSMPAGDNQNQQVK